MKLLIIGNIASQYITNFARALKGFNNETSIDIINVYPISNKQLTQTAKGVYQRIFNNQPLLGFIEKIPKLRGFIRYLNSKKILKEIKRRLIKYDVILLHGVGLGNCNMFRQINTRKNFSVCAIWGSDFYNRAQYEDVIFETIDLCDRVNISPNMIQEVLKVKNISKDKIRSCLFGLAPLEILFRNLQLSAKEAKQLLGLDEDDFIITCGYNGNPIQQHLEIIKAIAEVKDQLPPNYKLVLQMTYGRGDTSYQKQVKELLSEIKLKHIIYEDFMTEETVAYLRKATDIFIQVQKTDAFSGSMQEHLFAQNIVITGEWLSYPYLKEKDIYYETIESIALLSGKLSDVINNHKEIHEIIKLKNTPEKFKASLWSECIKDWYEVLNEYKNYN